MSMRLAALKIWRSAKVVVHATLEAMVLLVCIKGMEELALLAHAPLHWGVQYFLDTLIVATLVIWALHALRAQILLSRPL